MAGVHGERLGTGHSPCLIRTLSMHRRDSIGHHLPVEYYIGVDKTVAFRDALLHLAEAERSVVI